MWSEAQVRQVGSVQNVSKSCSRKAFDTILRGKSFVGRSKTGTGKTAAWFRIPWVCLVRGKTLIDMHRLLGCEVAYLLPLLERMRHEKMTSPHSLVILVPTRELCKQANGDGYSRWLKKTSQKTASVPCETHSTFCFPTLILKVAPKFWFRLQVGSTLLSLSLHADVALVYGGPSLDSQEQLVGLGATIVIATPGRCAQLIHRGAVHHLDQTWSHGCKEEKRGKICEFRSWINMSKADVTNAAIWHTSQWTPVHVFSWFCLCFWWDVRCNRNEKCPRTGDWWSRCHACISGDLHVPSSKGKLQGKLQGKSRKLEGPSWSCLCFSSIKVGTTICFILSLAQVGGGRLGYRFPLGPRQALGTSVGHFSPFPCRDSRRPYRCHPILHPSHHPYPHWFILIIGIWIYLNARIWIMLNLCSIPVSVRWTLGTSAGHLTPFHHSSS